MNQVGWEIRNLARWPVPFELTEDLPESIQGETPRVAATILPRASAEVHYGVRPTRRGLYEFGDIFLRWRTQLGLLVRQKRIRARDAVKVYPNVASLARYELAAQRHRRSEIGLMPVRLRGRGAMFESLREYVPGDDPGDVAWKASARHGRLITRNYETERSQNVLVVLDCGRLMVPPVDELSRLDCAINASLLLSYVAMKQGDHIGLVAFSDRIEAYVPPLRLHGFAQLRHLLSERHQVLLHVPLQLLESLLVCLHCVAHPDTEGLHRCSNRMNGDCPFLVRNSACGVPRVQDALFERREEGGFGVRERPRSR